VEQWRERGFVALSPGRIHRLDDLERLREKLKSESLRDGGKAKMPFGSQGKFEFPSMIEELNLVFLESRLIQTARELLGCREIRLTQADAWVKLGVEENAAAKRIPYSSIEQRMHMDFPNHDLVHPPPFDSPETVAVIVYLDNSEECGGETGVAPRAGPHDSAYSFPYAMPGFGSVPWINDRAQAENYLSKEAPELFEPRKKLYEREELVHFAVGTVLLYRHDIFHRGRPVKPGKSRLICNLVFKKAGADHITNWNTGFSRFFYNIKPILASKNLDEMPRPQVGHCEQLIEKLNPLQRSVLGFPSPGHEFWTNETIRAGESRWGVEVMKPYRNNLDVSKEARKIIAEMEKALEELLLKSRL